MTRMDRPSKERGEKKWNSLDFQKNTCYISQMSLENLLCGNQTQYRGEKEKSIPQEQSENNQI